MNRDGYCCSKKNKPLKFEPHGYCGTVALEAATVAEFAHEENAASATFFYALGTSGIRHAIGVEPIALVGYAHFECIIVANKCNMYLLGAIAAITVQHSVGNGFGERKEHIALCIGGQMVALGYIIYKRLYLVNITGV
jgi:hypothetical protein